MMTFMVQLKIAEERAINRTVLMQQLANQCEQIAKTEYGFLYDTQQNLLSIGFHVDELRRDIGFYDLLASEARLGIFVAIAQGSIPQDSWFALGRQLTNTTVAPILLSWSGSMFEYLMPLLVMPSYKNTLLDQTYKATIKKQIEYGKQRNVCWGISESGYNMFDAALNYQYRAFGVPGLGLKRGLGEDLVIAPYASVMALMVDPVAACTNMESLSAKGYEADFGFYEAIDYSPSRLARGKSAAIIRSFMVHHQGMSLLSLNHLLLNRPMQKRFESLPQFHATLLLLQERIPAAGPSYNVHTYRPDSYIVEGHPEMSIINTPHTAIPELQLLSNGRYHVMVSNSGGGYSKWNNLSVTRWREDGTCDNWGNFCYVYDIENKSYWSTAHQPTLKKAKSYEVVFSQGRAEFRRRDADIETYTEIIVSPEDDIEIRRVHLTNYSKKQKTLEITSYAEVVIATEAADSLHPAFSELFVETTILQPRNAIMCTRRPRSIGELPPYMFHLMKVHGAVVKEISFETDRMKFIGRGNSKINPAAVETTGTLSNSEGPVLYPVIAIKYRITIEPQQTIIADLIIGIHENKEGAQQLIERYNDRAMANRAFELSWTHSLVTLQQINATEADAQLYGKLASSVIYINPALRAEAKILLQNQSGQSALWSYSISGDIPIVLLRIADPENLELVKQMLQAHAYWRLKGLLVDLVIWNEDRSVYRQQLQNLIIGLISPSITIDMRERPGGIFIRNSEQISNEDRILFQTISRVIISDSAGSLEEQVNKRAKTKLLAPSLITQKIPGHYPDIAPSSEELQFNNGMGGFSSSGKEYVITTDKTKLTALPWCNVIANPNFGTVISESGQAYTWAENAHEYRLTPWNNDPVSDSSGEAFYIRDEETGLFWSPMALPVKGNGPYTCRHGFGYSVFEHSEEGIESSVSVYVDIADAIKIVVVKLKNQFEKTRMLSVTGYMDWVLGDLKTKSNMHLITELDKASNAVLVSNPYNRAFPNRVVFFDADGISQSFTTDRNEFIGRNGSLFNPAAMGRIKLSGKTGAGLDACASIQNYIELQGYQEQEIIFLAGAAKDKKEALQLITKYSVKNAAGEALERVQQYWNKTLEAVKIQTPDASINSIANGWLNYQTLASRLWGRSGYYQSGGAFGFRDQLQDVLSLLHSRPEMVRTQILLHASRQFIEGDVQHWWHPPEGRGVRTRCSDDYLWLPFVLDKYLTHTGDYDILKETEYFLDGRILNENEESYYDLPQRSPNKGSIYEHCCKSITHGLRMGVHGLPLMGSGDWNDGMDQVGIHGRGESVWLAHFLYDVLIKFSGISEKHNDMDFSTLCIDAAEKLQINIEKNAWDGNWYKRAFFDDGTALGSSINTECSIDAIAQSWSVLSNSGSPERTHIAMESAYTYLVKKEISLIQLLQPAFDKSDLNPGYIKGYVPGVRENGGQYTHAAIWMIMAFAKLHDTEKTWELLKMINPVNHALTAAAVKQYMAEPYVIAADVYASPSHLGRGGWTWYTGSASWMYQLILESVLGLKRKGNTLTIQPCIPKSWKTFSIDYQFLQSQYQITVIQNDETALNKLVLDGNPQTDNILLLVNDQQIHNVIIYC
jgi:cellobiose phosphorylase